jgi:hypothetical protein
MKKTNISMMAFIALLSVTSCHKGDATSATIDIMEPMVNDTVAYDDSVHFEGTIVGDGTMYGYKLTYENAATGAEYMSFPSEEKAKSYAFHEHWHNQVMDTTAVTLKVEATLDHKGTKTSKLIQVVCLPQ